VISSIHRKLTFLGTDITIGVRTRWLPPHPYAAPHHMYIYIQINEWKARRIFPLHCLSLVYTQFEYVISTALREVEGERSCRLLGGGKRRCQAHAALWFTIRIIEPEQSKSLRSHSWINKLLQRQNDRSSPTCTTKFTWTVHSGNQVADEARVLAC
jgi:hypothetical protein